MIFAIDKSGNKIRAYKGGSANCPNPFCNSELIAKCGDYNIWHWAHINLRSCDSWDYESITDWHLSWQDNYPDNKTEVIIRKGNEVHIADIVCKDGLVIEIQNSPIISSEVRRREQFYKKMIWVINSDPFKHNLTLKDFKYNFTKEIWFQYIQPMIGTAFDFAIFVPVDDNGAILDSLILNNYEKYYDSKSGKIFYSRRRTGSDYAIPLEVHNSFSAYLLDKKIRERCISEKSYKTTFRWKSLRKTWMGATMPIFLDLNNGFLFYIKTLYANGNGSGLVISKKRFLEKYQ